MIWRSTRIGRAEVEKPSITLFGWRMLKLDGHIKDA